MVSASFTACQIVSPNLIDGAFEARCSQFLCEDAGGTCPNRQRERCRRLWRLTQARPTPPASADRSEGLWAEATPRHEAGQGEVGEVPHDRLRGAVPETNNYRAGHQ